jgi:hypothetical protein
MEHIKKSIIEQIAILSDHKCHGREICVQFIRNHAMSIVQLTDEAIVCGGVETRSQEANYSA